MLLRGDILFDLVGYLTQIDTGKIDNAYMNSKFTKYHSLLQQHSANQKLIDQALDELCKTFAILSQEKQKYSNIFLHDVQSGKVIVQPGKTLIDYITEYQSNAKNDQVHVFADTFGLDEAKTAHDDEFEPDRLQYQRIWSL